MNKKLTNRRVGFERLDDRILMTGDCDIDQQIQQVGRAILVSGCDGQTNEVRLSLNVDEFLVSLNGESRRYSTNDVDRVNFVGGDNADELRIDSRLTTDELIRIVGGSFSLQGDGYEVSVHSAEIVRVAPSPGFDVVEIRDSPGNDHLYMHDDFSTFVNADGEVFKLSGMQRVEAESNRGGRDRVWFYDSPAEDRFVSKGPGATRESFAYMVGDDFWNYAKGFAQVDAISRDGGRDEARLYGTPVRDVVDAEYLDVELRAAVATDSTTVTRVRGYAATRTYSEGGDDGVMVSGAPNVTDRFVWKPHSAFMHSNTVFPDTNDRKNRLLLESSNVFVGFQEINATGEPSDFAELHGTSGRDEFVAIADVARLTTDTGPVVNVNDFRFVRAHSRGGRDSAHLMGSPGNDRYVSRGVYAYLEGEDWLNWVSPGFDIVADVTGPGHDTANPTRYSKDRFEVLVEDGRELMVYGSKRVERLFGFDEAHAEAYSPISPGNRTHLLGTGLFVKDPARFPLTLSGTHTEIFSDHEAVSDIIALADTDFPVYELVGGRIRRVQGDDGWRGIVLSRNFVPVVQDEFRIEAREDDRTLNSRLGTMSGAATLRIDLKGLDNEDVVLFKAEEIVVDDAELTN